MQKNKKLPFNRIFDHRLDAASQYLHDKEQTKEFTNTIQGNRLTEDQVKLLKRRKLSFIGHLPKKSLQISKLSSI